MTLNLTSLLNYIYEFFREKIIEYNIDEENVYSTPGVVILHVVPDPEDPKYLVCTYQLDLPRGDGLVDVMESMYKAEEAVVSNWLDARGFTLRTPKCEWCLEIKGKVNQVDCHAAILRLCDNCFETLHRIQGR